MLGLFVQDGFYTKCGVCNTEFIEEQILDRHVEARRLRDRNEQKETLDKYAELEKTDKKFAKNIKDLKSNIRKFGGCHTKLLKELNKLKKEYINDIEPFVQSITSIRKKYKMLANQLPLWKEWMQYKRKKSSMLSKILTENLSVERRMIFKYIHKYNYYNSDYKYSKSYIFYKTFRRIIL
jgi:septal ring factor EnvC (AmiA/AmiB activator)